MHTALAVLGNWQPGPGFAWWFLFIPLFWIGIFALVFALVGRRWRRWGGPYGHWAHSGALAAESALATRYANGEIDETEYQSRLHVLRASQGTPPGK